MVDNLASHHANSFVIFRHLDQGCKCFGIHNGVVVKQPHKVRTLIEGIADADVITTGKAKVGAGLDELDVREPLAQDRFGTVARAVVDDQDAKVWIRQFPT